MACYQGTSCSVIMEKCIIVAIADNYAIGKGNDIPWHISEDLKFFKRTTSGYPVIMGRKTYESIGRPLPKRTNIVITRGCELPEAVVQVKSLDEAYVAAQKACQETGADKCFVMGGGKVYASAMESADCLYVTHVHTEIDDAEVFFPAIDPEVWVKSEGSEMMTDPETGYDFEFVTYVRK